MSRLTSLTKCLDFEFLAENNTIKTMTKGASHTAPIQRKSSRWLYIGKVWWDLTTKRQRTVTSSLQNNRE